MKTINECVHEAIKGTILKDDDMVRLAIIDAEKVARSIANIKAEHLLGINNALNEFVDEPIVFNYLYEIRNRMLSQLINKHKSGTKMSLLDQVAC
jgi:hypothetical protein